MFPSIFNIDGYFPILMLTYCKLLTAYLLSVSILAPRILMERSIKILTFLLDKMSDIFFHLANNLQDFFCKAQTARRSCWWTWAGRPNSGTTPPPPPVFYVQVFPDWDWVINTSMGDCLYTFLHKNLFVSGITIRRLMKNVVACYLRVQYSIWHM